MPMDPNNATPLNFPFPASALADIWYNTETVEGSLCLLQVGQGAVGAGIAGAG